MLEEKGEEMRRELEEERWRLLEKLERIRKSEGMTARYVAEKKRTEARTDRMEQERKRTMDEYERRLNNLLRRLQNLSDESMTKYLQGRTDASVAKDLQDRTNPSAAKHIDGPPPSRYEANQPSPVPSVMIACENPLSF